MFVATEICFQKKNEIGICSCSFVRMEWEKFVNAFLRYFDAGIHIR